MKNKIEVLVRAIIQDKGKILVCKKKGNNYYFFPGGHIDFGESAEKALVREIREELGLKIKKYSFIGGSEHLFTEDGRKHHEINLVFEVKVKKLKFESKENHIDFYLKTKEDLIKERVLPIALTKAVLKWLRDKKLFWVSQID